MRNNKPHFSRLIMAIPIFAVAGCAIWMLGTMLHAAPAPPKTDKSDLAKIPIATKGVGVEAAGKWGTVKPRLAVVPFSTDSAHPDAGDLLGDQLISQVKAGQYEIFDRNKLSELLAEQQLEPANLANDAAAIRFGRLIGVEYLVVGAIAKDRDFNVTTKLLDCKTGQIISHASAHFAAVDHATNALAILAAEMKLRDDRPAPSPEDNASLFTPVNDAFKVKIQTMPDKKVFDEGEYVSFTITVNRACFITLITRDSQKNETVLVPNPWQMNQIHLEKGGTFTFPPTDGATFRFPIVAPHGQTIVKVIATTRELQLAEVDRQKMELASKGIGEKTLVQPVHGARAIGVQADSAGDTTPVSQTGSASQTGTPIADILKPDEWSTDEVTFVTQPRN